MLLLAPINDAVDIAILVITDKEFAHCSYRHTGRATPSTATVFCLAVAKPVRKG